MGTVWHSMWYRLVLVYQPAVRGSCDGRTAGMCGEAMMAEPWEGVGEAAMDETNKAQERASVSYLILRHKPSTHSMCVQESSLHTYSTKNGYRITNVSI
jgi:hypothetical protein